MPPDLPAIERRLWATTIGHAAVTLAAAAAGLALAACSGGSTRSIPSTSGPSISTTSATTAVPATTAAVDTTCRPSQLHIVRSGHSGAAGTGEVTFSLTNSSPAPCTMRGYPGILLLDAGGRALPTAVVRGGGLAFESVAVTNVSLAEGHAAYFNLGYSDVTTGATGCSNAAQVEITPPNATAHAIVPVSSNIDACNNGTVHVSPVFASTNTAATQTTAPA